MLRDDLRTKLEIRLELILRLLTDFLLLPIQILCLEHRVALSLQQRLFDIPGHKLRQESFRVPQSIRFELFPSNRPLPRFHFFRPFQVFLFLWRVGRAQYSFSLVDQVDIDLSLVDLVG